jgi:hypothetical protein
LVVDCEGGDLLDELEEVDCGVEEGGLEFFLEVRVGVFGFDALDVLRDVDEGGDVDGELAEDRTDDVDVEDVVLRALFGECFDGLVGVSVVGKGWLEK